MKKTIENYGGLALFYIFIIASVFIVNVRFEYLNKIDNVNNNLYAIKN